jgi:hypothetical protein
MIRQLGLLWMGSLALWLVCAACAWLLSGQTGLLDTTVACALCLVPMTATLVWAHGSSNSAPEQQLLAVLGGTGVRLMVAIGGGIALSRTVEALARPAFLVWVVVFYLLTLTLEIVLVVRQLNGSTAAAPVPRQSSATLPDRGGPNP